MCVYNPQHFWGNKQCQFFKSNVFAPFNINKMYYFYCLLLVIFDLTTINTLHITGVKRTAVKSNM